MMVWPAHGVPHPVGLATWRVVHNVATSCRGITSAICAPVRLAVWCCNVARLYSRLSARFTGHDNTVCAHVLDVPR
jgi:hypothetical protein